MKIDKPGIYPDMATADYFADPCPRPSLTQSVAKILIDECPLHAWHACPSLNPDYVHDDDKKFDVGNIAHKLMLGRGKEITVLDFADWRTKAAQEAREAAAKVGQLAVLRKHFDRATKMVVAAREQLELRGLTRLFNPTFGRSEVVLAWREGDIWFRQMVDWLNIPNTTFCDFKTTEMSVAPHGLGRMMATAGWHIQAAMADRGLTKIEGKKRRQFIFVVQEASPPYSLNVVEMTDDVMVMGHKMLNHAADTWASCMVSNQFPGYPLETVRPELPGWTESQWLEREVQEAARARMPQKIDTSILMAG